MDDLLEKLAELEHKQWEQWSRAVADEVSVQRRVRWQQYWVPYVELPESSKELDREWARRVLDTIAACGLVVVTAAKHSEDLSGCTSE
jgi:hypothetical protein